MKILKKLTAHTVLMNAKLSQQGHWPLLNEKEQAH